MFRGRAVLRHHRQIAVRFAQRPGSRPAETLRRSGLNPLPAIISGGHHRAKQAWGV